jgi:DNA-binding NarL/FixJ family response regulator
VEDVKVYIVEDSPIVLLELKIIFDKHGYTIAGQSTSGEDALENAIKTDPDIILMDILLEGQMDGIETAIELKKMSSIPILFMSAISDEDMKERMKNSGCEGFVSKPYNFKLLIAKIESIITNSKK